MSNLMKKPPMGLKKPKDKKDEAYLKQIREQPCCVCRKFGEIQRSPTTAHHVIHDRAGFRRSHDRLAIPLCEDHHQGLWGTDKSKIAIHQQPLKWREKYGPDWSYSKGDYDE